MKHIPQEQLTLLEAMQKMAPDSSKTTLRSWLKNGRVFVDNIMVKIGATSVTPGQVITLGTKPQPDKIKTLYSDRHLVIIDKPAGILSVATNYETTKTAHSFLKETHKSQKIHPVHRLDRDTSGVMVFALTLEARDGLKDLFETHDIHRQYHAIVEGHLENPTGKWKSYLYEDKNYHVHSTENPENAKLAITHYEVIKTTKKTSHLKLTLETGRKNQIRVHCQDAGHHVLGDKKYGPGTIPCKRLCLHAHLLQFTHPITGKKMSFESPVPKHFK
ncbi:MAG: Ribosomal large subunit pseudouridine synthase D [Chlamydiae bacterium]|nr:Ribosomal large subunit pseudouridine synthase D [Chlamydiota bacterium]